MKEEISVPVYKIKEVVFEDQFGNKCIGVLCKFCEISGKPNQFEAYHNYGGTVKKIHFCDNCLREHQEAGFDVSRNKKRYCSITWGMRGIRGNPKENLIL